MSCLIAVALDVPGVRVPFFVRPKKETKKRAPYNPLPRQNDAQLAVGSNAGPTALSLKWHPCHLTPT
jgi:hypothetical protein